ncbi:hypothetical protein J5N97_009738 [Dioscorea zingiberensis]|uniref:Uncharacterized protein n=1 Tax=Dioscorea zingiberensis TaxID=325984 RepID=A0A9D5HM55_9LILI|nr:hypothetical protein J5N97_009738 [Dioscorea zingiberensis]
MPPLPPTGGSPLNGELHRRTSPAPLRPCSAHAQPLRADHSRALRMPSRAGARLASLDPAGRRPDAASQAAPDAQLPSSAAAASPAATLARSPRRSLAPRPTHACRRTVCRPCSRLSPDSRLSSSSAQEHAAPRRQRPSSPPAHVRHPARSYPQRRRLCRPSPAVPYRAQPG